MFYKDHLFLNIAISSAKLFFFNPNHMNEKIPIPNTVADGSAIAVIVNGLTETSLISLHILHSLSYLSSYRCPTALACPQTLHVSSQSLE